MKVNNQKKAGEILSLSELIIDEEICINLRGRMIHCTSCSDTCPSDALTLSADSIDLDNDKCTGCNSCLPSCAAGALRSSSFIPSRFLATLNNQSESVHLHCRSSTDPGGGIVIPCHSVLDSRLLMAVKSEQIDTIYLHGLPNCGNCNLGDATDYIEVVKKEVSHWLGDDSLIVITHPDNVTESQSERQFQDQEYLSRRSFLKIGSAKAINQAVEWFVPGLMSDEEDEEELLPFYQADDYPQRASQYLQALVERVDKLSWVSQALPWQIRYVNEQCSGCLSCGERCPTGALYAHENNEKRELFFDPALCTDCQLCERICPEKAIVSNSAKSVEEVISGKDRLFHLYQALCSRCKTTFLPNETHIDLCPVCSNEQDLDDEWLEMLSD